MIISHNLLAMNANRQFNIINKNKAKSTEKLSSGYRINRASDDAAGLSISEKMRWQIRGLNQGVRNTQDGVSVCQVADGALGEVSAMLHRITELAVQSANGTYTDEDREAIQHEIAQIMQEIDRIGDNTEFNERKIFKGASDNFGGNVNTSVITVNRNYKIEGMPIDKTVLNYNISAATEKGISINGNLYSWDNVIGKSGENLGDNDIKPDTYSIDYNGLKISFDVTEYDDMKSITNALNNLEINANYTPPKSNSINSISFKLYTPSESGNMSRTELSSFVRQNKHTVIADSNGVKIDLNGTVKSWSTIFSEAGITEEDAKINGGTLNLGETGKYDLIVTFNAGTDIEDIVDEINGMKFQIEGSIDDATVINAYNPCNTSISATCTNFSLSSAFMHALGYDVLYGDKTMKAIYDDSNKSSKYPHAVNIQFCGNTDVVSNVINGYLVASNDSVKKLEQIFSSGTTSQSGSVTIDFVSPGAPVTPTYGASNVSIKWDYPAGINERDLWHALGSGLTSPLRGADALDMTIKTKYSTTGLQVNKIDIPEKISLQYNDSKVDNTIAVSVGTIDDSKDLSLWIQSGSEAGQGMYLEIDRMNTNILGINDLDVSTVDGANHAIDAVQGALDIVSSSRSKIGAQQNRLEHTISNNQNNSENTTAAESRIRDTDIADEMVKFSKESILENVGQAMLAQSNQFSQNVLSLLQ